MNNIQYSFNDQQITFKKLSNFDLESRTAVFAERVIDLCKSVKITPLNKRIVDQLIGSSGSIGANYCEACEAESKKDFQHKMCIAKKEIKETKHWLRLLARANPEKRTELRILWQEAHEFLLIFAKSIKTSRGQ